MCPHTLTLTLTLTKVCDKNRYHELGVGRGTELDCIYKNQTKKCTKKCREGCKEDCKAETPECGETLTLNPTNPNPNPNQP